MASMPYWESRHWPSANCRKQAPLSTAIQDLGLPRRAKTTKRQPALPVRRSSGDARKRIAESRALQRSWSLCIEPSSRHRGAYQKRLCTTMGVTTRQSRTWQVAASQDLVQAGELLGYPIFSFHWGAGKVTKHRGRITTRAGQTECEKGGRRSRYLGRASARNSSTRNSLGRGFFR